MTLLCVISKESVKKTHKLVVNLVENLIACLKGSYYALLRSLDFIFEVY